jgi:hypothetical protein
MWSQRIALVALMLLGCVAVAEAIQGPEDITALVLDPRTPATLYAGTLTRGVLRSTDAWTWTATGLTGARITALAIDPETPGTLYAATSDRGVVKSTDGASTWLATNLTGAVLNLVLDPEVPTTLYAVVADTGAFKSENGGIDWRAIGPPRGLIRALAIDQATPTVVFVATADGIYRSVDAGASWGAIGLTGHDISRLASSPPRVYADTPQGVFSTTDGGVWSPTDHFPSEMVPQTPATLYAGTPSGVFKSADGGSTWFAANAGLTDVLVARGAPTTISAITLNPAAPEMLYAATQIGVFTSQDGAVTWQPPHPRWEQDCFDGMDDDMDGLHDTQDPDCPLTCLWGEPCPGGYVCNPNGFCETHCGNGFKDGDEGDVDCGGSCAARCMAGRTCWVSSDCASGICVSSICAGSSSHLISVSVDPPTVVGGGPALGNVTLASPAPAGGTVVTLASTLPNVATVPGSVTVPAGSTIAAFTVTTTAATSATSVMIYATDGGVSHVAQLTVLPLPRPVVASISPSRGPVGTAVTLTGTRLESVTRVRFAGGAVASVLSSSVSSLSITVPSGALTGPVTVESVVGADNTAVAFTVTPSITGVTPNPAFAGGTITVTGTSLRVGSASPTVRIGSLAATVLAGGSAGQLQFTIPVTATTGRVTVTTDDGTATSAANLVVVRRPTIVSFTPTAGPPGTVVSVAGSNLTAVTEVLFNGTAGGLISVSSTSLRTTVPDGASRGPITFVTPAGTVSSATAFTVAGAGDLRVMSLVVPPAAAIGRSITVGTTVRNAGGWTVPASVLRLYMSADETLDLGDRILAVSATPALPAGATVAVNVPVTIPAELTAGTYRILALVDAAGTVREADETNNVGVSAPVAVTFYRPNLVVSALTPPARGAIGQPILVPHTVANTGPASAGPFTVRFHVSTDTLLDAGDPVVGQRALSGLAAASTNTATTSLLLPVTLNQGPYYVIAVADALAHQLEIDETNNALTAGPVAVVPYQPELAMMALTVPARWGVGQAVVVSNTVRNTGLGPATAFSIRFHLSRDDVIDATDPEVGRRAVGGLAAGGASATSTSLRVPALTGPGQYQLIAVVDWAGQQAELDETNNITVSAPFSVMVLSPGDGAEPGPCGAARPLGWARLSSCPPIDPGIGGDGDD